MDLDKFYEWEKMNVTYIIYLMIKWFNFDAVNFETRNRPDVESCVWVDIKIEKDKKTWYVSGQRPDIIHRRLIEFLDGQNIRADYLQKTLTKTRAKTN